MGSLKVKLIVGVSAVALLIGAQAVITRMLAAGSVEHMAEAEEVGVRGALLGERIKFDVVQVQQWLTDISATRAQDGLNDGFEVAEAYAADFEVATAELERLRPELAPELAELSETFDVYHAVGIEMAEAYIAGGPADGNVMMGEFDAAAAAMGDSVDALVADLLAEAERSLDQASSSARNVGSIALLASAAIAILAALIGGAIVMSVMRQLTRVTRVASEIADGNFDVERLPANDDDVLGRLAGSFNRMTDMLAAAGRRADEIAAGHISARHDIPGDLGRAFDTMSGSMSTMVDQLRGSSQRLSNAASGLSGISAQVGASAERTAAEAESASRSGADVSSAVGNVAAAIEQMNATIQEVASNAGEAASVATDAVGVARDTSSKIAKLGESSEEVGNVIKVIKSIAEQTNLLALNATIEAARAGEAGKGFAVVANEVKALADQTAQATQEISDRIEAIQADTDGAVRANTRIGETIDRINEISITIAGAVEEQSVTTAEIGRSVEEVAVSSQGIAASIADVARAAGETRSSTEQTAAAAAEMTQTAAELDRLVGRYR